MKLWPGVYQTVERAEHSAPADGVLNIECRVMKRSGSFRWVICALLFAATTLNYIDRQVLGVLAPTLQQELRWSESQYGFIVTAFQAAYAVGLLGFGPFIDRIGTRIGYLIAVAFWSVSAALHGFAGTAVQFGVARFALGLGEAGNLPAAIKTISEWFPRSERAFAIGLFNCGSNVGAVVTPLAVPVITLWLGWRWAFILTGLAGFGWVVAWLGLYRKPPGGAAEDPAASPSWASLIGYRETWALIFARFLTDPVWWFYLYWAPKFLHSRYGLTLDQIGPPLVIIYLAADAGSVFGGWLSSLMIARGLSVNAARKLAILVCALMVTPMMFASEMSTTWAAVAVLSLATAGHQGWAANMFASISDIFPHHAVSSVTGLSGFGGAIGGMLVSTAAGFLLEATGSYVPVFVWAGLSYLVVLGLLQLMIPRIQPMVLGSNSRRLVTAASRS